MLETSKDKENFFSDLIKTAALSGIKLYSSTFSADNNSIYFYNEDVYDETAFPSFNDGIKNHLLDRTAAKTIFIVGEAGIGKSTFLKQLTKRSDFLDTYFEKQKKAFKLTNEGSIFFDFNYCIDDAIRGDYFFNKVVHSIKEKFCDDKEIVSALVEAVKQTKKEEAEFNLPGGSKGFELARVLQKISKVLGRKGLDLAIIFDNVDICPLYFQKKAAHFFMEVSCKLSELLPKESFFCKFRFIMTARKDTFSSWKACQLLGNYPHWKLVDFPKPFVYKIARNIFGEAVKRLVHSGKISIPTVTMWLQDKPVEITNKQSLINYIVGVVFDQPEQCWSEYMDIDFHGFHNCFVNFNVRRYGLLILHCIVSGNYEPMNFLNYKKFRKFDYLRILLTGSKKSIDDYVQGNVLMYNALIKPNEAAGGFPVIFNLFETYTLSEKRDNVYYEDVFTVYIRILQYLWIKKMNQENSEPIKVTTVINGLKKFFPEDVLKNALGKLIYAGVLRETSLSSRNNAQNEEHIKFKSNGIIAEIDFCVKQESLCAGALYLKSILIEYEYIVFCGKYYVLNKYSALRNTEFNQRRVDYVKNAENELKISDTENESLSRYCEDEYIAVRFLVAMFEIVYSNIEKYKQDPKTFKEFKSIFHSDKYMHANKNNEPVHLPWRRITKSVINAIGAKKKFADDSGQSMASRAKWLGVLLNKFLYFSAIGADKFEVLIHGTSCPNEDRTKVINMLKEQTIEQIAKKLSITEKKVVEIVIGN